MISDRKPSIFRRFINFFFKADYVYCTIVIFLFMYGISEVLDRFAFLNPIEMALDDFELTDIVFSENIRDDQMPDTSIVLVNFGNLQRRGIARQIECIAAQNPKVLGIDCSFTKLKKAEDDSLLSAALSKIKHLVLYSKVDHTDEGAGHFDTLIRCNPKFARWGTSGFCNLPTEGIDKYKTCRTFHPVDQLGGLTERAFAVEIARIVDSTKVNDFLSRGNEIEIINYRGNKQMFYSLDVTDFDGIIDSSGFVHEPKLYISLKDKIVIMGYMGDNFNRAGITIEDKFHTPMNEKYAGKAYPDMFGVVVHANIVSMVLNGSPMNQMGKIGGALLAIFLCYLNVVFFFYIHDYFPSWYDLVVKTMQVLEVFVLLFIVVMVYGNYRYQLDVTVAAIAIGLSGDILEVYTGAMYNIVGRFIERIKSLFVKRKQKLPIKQDSDAT